MPPMKALLLDRVVQTSRTRLKAATCCTTKSQHLGRIQLRGTNQSVRPTSTWATAAFQSKKEVYDPTRPWSCRFKAWRARRRSRLWYEAHAHLQLFRPGRLRRTCHSAIKQSKTFWFQAPASDRSWFLFAEARATLAAATRTWPLGGDEGSDDESRCRLDGS